MDSYSQSLRYPWDEGTTWGCWSVLGSGPLVIIIYVDDLAKMYEDPDYTVVITVFHLPKHTHTCNFVLEFTLIVELWVCLSSCQPAYLDDSFQLSLCVQLSGKTKKILLPHHHIPSCTETHPIGKAVNTFNKYFFLPFGRHCSLPLDWL